MSLTIQTIEELLTILAKGESVRLHDIERLQHLMETHTLDLLAAARWALERGYGQESDDEIVESPDMRAAKVFKNGFEVTYAKDGESVAIDQPNSSSQDGRKG